MKQRAVWPALLAVWAAGAGFASAQQQRPPDEDLRQLIRQMNERIDALEQRHDEDQKKIESLEKRLVHVEEARSDEQHQAEIDQIKDEIRTELGAPQQPSLFDLSSGSMGSGNALNPQLTVFLETGGSISSRGKNKALNRFNLREVELDLRAAVTPTVDGVLIVALGEEIESKRNGEVSIDRSVDLEEGYLDFHTLPHNLALKVGKFRNAFGRNNMLHTHDLPQVTRPLAVRSFFGEEGLSTTGASLSWLVPNPWDKYIETTLEVVNSDGGEESPILGGPNADNPAVVAHVKLFTDVTDTSSLEVGGSYLYGHSSGDSDFDANVFGLDVAYQWTDPDPSKFRSWLLQGEVFWSHNDIDRGWLFSNRNNAMGAYAFAQYQFAQNWYTGLRGDYAEYPNSPGRGNDDSDVAVSPYLTWYITEFLRARLQYEHRWSDLWRGSSEEDAVFLQFTGVFGTHPPHPYWVRK